MDALTKFRTTHISRLSVKDIFGLEPEFKNLIELFQKMPAEPTLTLLSNMAVSFANDGLPAVETYLRKELLSPDFRAALEDKERRDSSRLSLFNEMTLVLLTDLCREFSPNDNSIQMTFHEIGRHLGYGFIVGNYFANLPNEHGSDGSRESYTKFAIRESIFNEHDQFRYCLGRAKIIYDLLKAKVPPAHRFDVSAFLLAQFGFSLDDYFQAIIALFSQWGNQTVSKWDPSRNFIVDTNFFAGTENHENLSRVIEYLTQAWRLSNRPFVDLVPEAIREYLYSQFELKSKPLIKINGRTYPLSMRFLMLLSWTGPYYLVIDRLRSIGEPRDQFFHYLGHATEFYCSALAEYTFKKKFIRRKTPAGHPMGDFIIEVNPGWHIVFEIKATRPNLDAIRGDRPLKDNSTVRTAWIEPLTQFSVRLIEYRHTFKKRITPVIVTPSALFMNEITWPCYFELVQHLSMFQDQNCETPVLLDLETFEVLCACVQSGHPVGEIFRQKNSRNWRHDEFKNFLYHFWLPRMRGEPTNEPVRDASTNIFELLKQRLFPSASPLSDEPEVDWRAILGIQ
ncbi:MAG: hypothetical protein NDI61_06705 [Bdellovibrionaceae bacterium]|nr:hypothetical protein [Pseudobdellovibrionaceae bacterium]